MANYKLKTLAGQHFQAVSVRAQTIAQIDKTTVEFDFNGVTCLVNKDTNLDYLFRDYGIAHTMEWKTIGPECVEAYSSEVQSQLDERNAAAARKAEDELQEYQKKNQAERVAFEQAVEGIPFDVVEGYKYNHWKATNSDSYGRFVFEYAEGWARLMQKAMLDGQTLEECARPTSFQLGFLGISGAQYGFAVSVLANCWAYGDELLAWHESKLISKADND